MYYQGFSRNHGDNANGSSFLACDDREYYGGIG